jgi:hypothetical protein
MNKAVPCALKKTMNMDECKKCRKKLKCKKWVILKYFSSMGIKGVENDNKPEAAYKDSK